MENLNKENFWDALREKHPEAVDLFCKWIDEYKKSVGWGMKFVILKSAPDLSSDVKGTVLMKFHDLPFEMQYGILIRFFNETIPGGFIDMGTDFAKLFWVIQKRIKAA